jgi:tellurite resistance protein TerC
MQGLIYHGKRVVRITGGVVVMLVGIFLSIPGVPGPGLILVFVGLSILAVDFVWAHRLKTKIKEGAGKVVDRVRGREVAPPGDKPSP